MNELPNIAKARLAAQVGAPGPHPDADQLTAFVEQGLGAPEREKVLSHLSACANCREVVALAAPEAAVPMPATAGTGFRSYTFLGMNLMRWAAVSACVVVVASVMLLNRQSQPEQFAKMVARKSDDYSGVQQVSNSASATPQAAAVPKDQVEMQAEMKSTDKVQSSENLRSGAKGASAAVPANAKEGRERRDEAQSPPAPVMAGALRATPDLAKAKVTDNKVVMAGQQVSPEQQRAGYNLMQQQPGGAVVSNQFTVNGVANNDSGAVGGVVQSKSLAGKRTNETKTLADTRATASNANFDANNTQQKQQNTYSYNAAPAASLAPAPANSTAGGVGGSANNSANSNFSGGYYNTANATNKSANTAVEVSALNAAVTTAAEIAAPAMDATIRKKAEKDSADNETAAKAKRTAAPSGLVSVPAAAPNGFVALTPGAAATSLQNYRLLAGGRVIHLDAASNTWQPVEIASGFKARVVTEVVGGVWVAGTDGAKHTALYRSSDSKTWQRVSGPWTGEIVVLHFSSALSGEVIIANGESWKTTDGGTSWKK